MKNTIVTFVILTGFGLSSTALAKDETPAFGEKTCSSKNKKAECEPCKAREKTPEEKCKAAHGKWTGDMCVKTRIMKKRIIRRVETPAVPPVDFELQCYRRNGEWRDGLCYGKREPAPVTPPPAKPVVVKQEQRVTVKNTTLVPPKPNLPLPPPKKAEKGKWWWIGPGVWALGLWAGEKDFVPGIYGSLVFAINQRFRVAGNIGVGYGPWQENGRLDVWVGGTFAVRAYKGLFVNFGVETMWGGFDGLSVHRRMLATSAGPEYWFGDRASISLRFLVGLHDNVSDCQIKSGQVVGGNLFTTTVYF